MSRKLLLARAADDLRSAIETVTRAEALVGMAGRLPKTRAAIDEALCNLERAADAIEDITGGPNG